MAPPLLGIPYIELLKILRMTYKVIIDLLERRMFNSQTIEVSNSPSYRPHRASQYETEKSGYNGNNTNMLDYLVQQ